MKRHVDFIDLLNRMSSGDKLGHADLEAIAGPLVQFKPDGYFITPSVTGFAVYRASRGGRRLVTLSTPSPRGIRRYQLDKGIRYDQVPPHPDWYEVLNFKYRTEAEDNLLRLKAGSLYGGIVHFYEQMIRYIELGIQDEYDYHL